MTQEQHLAAAKEIARQVFNDLNNQRLMKWEDLSDGGKWTRAIEAIEIAITNQANELTEKSTEEKAKAFDEDELSILAPAVNCYWYEAKIQLDRKDLGDIERQLYQKQLDKCKAFLMKRGF